jgi:hypothetical protein
MCAAEVPSGIYGTPRLIDIKGEHGVTLSNQAFPAG